MQWRISSPLQQSVHDHCSTRDVPIVRNATEGSKNMALTIAGDPGLLSEAIAKYKGDVRLWVTRRHST